MTPSPTSSFVVLVVIFITLSFSTVHANVPGQLPQIGNGFVATFVTEQFEYVSGLFNGFNTSSHRAEVPSMMVFSVSCPNGSNPSPTTPFDPHFEGGKIMQTVSCPPTGTVTYTWYAHRVYRNLMVLEMEINNTQSQAATFNINSNNLSPEASVDLKVMNKGKTQNTTWALYSVKDPEEQQVPKLQLGAAASVPPSSVQVPGNSIARLMVVTARCLSLESDKHTGGDVLKCAQSRVAEAVAMGLDKLHARHGSAWKDLWTHNMHVEGDAQLETVIGASMYALLSALRDEAWPFSTSPGGLVTSGYNGHTFWDMETWMLPTLNLFYPSLARSALRYRLDRLRGAQMKASSFGYSGAMYPWESALSGYEVCPWQQGSWMENHITADIVLGLWQQYCVSSDKSFLSEFFPILNQTAEYWISRSTGLSHLNNVIPPDEYHTGNDSVYTNAAVKKCLQATVTAASSLQTPVDPRVQQLINNLPILYDTTNDMHPEFAGYDGSTVKQADVILMNFPIGYPMNTSTVKNDLDYYAKRTDPNGPAMTWSMFAVGYLSIGDTVNGMQYFRRGYVNNSLPPYYQWYEVVGGSGCPNFITGAGGFLQSVWAGLGGLRVSDVGVLTITPNAALPSTVTKLKLQKLVIGGGAFVNVEYTQGGKSVKVTLVQEATTGSVTANGQPLTLNNGVTFSLAGGKGINIAYQA
eukprot:PhF_6_TR657/c0_g1_i1/m.956/K22078/PGGHG, ATHL1; protein-glucosylgalactosylhydroxylysine glucosidase